MNAQTSLEFRARAAHGLIEITGSPEQVLEVATDIFQDVSPGQYDFNPGLIRDRYDGKKTTIEVGLHILKLEPTGDRLKLEYHITQRRDQFQLTAERVEGMVVNRSAL